MHRIATDLLSYSVLRTPYSSGNTRETSTHQLGHLLRLTWSSKTHRCAYKYPGVPFATRCASLIRSPGRPVPRSFHSFSCAVDRPSQGVVPCLLDCTSTRNFLPSAAHHFYEPLSIRYKPSILFLFLFFPPFPPASVPYLFRLVTFPGFAVRSFFTFATELSRHSKIKLPQRRTTSARVSRLINKKKRCYSSTTSCYRQQGTFIYFLT